MQAVETKLSLARFFHLMGINPLHAQGVFLDEMSRNANNQQSCSLPSFQYEWQNSDAVGREEVARAIADTERDIENFIGYHLLPTWDEDEWVQTTRPFRAEAFNLNSRDVRGRSQVVVPKWGYAISGGIRSVEALAGATTITYSADRLPATWQGLATVTYASAVELPDCEIAVYYPGHAGDEKYRIRPVTVTHDLSLVYTITFRRELCLIEDVLESYNLQELRGINGDDDANFLTTVDVCRVYNDPQQQATMLWEGQVGCTSCGSSGVDCARCGYSTATACLLLRGDPRLSQFVYQPGTWDATTFSFSATGAITARQPDTVRLWYYSGWRNQRATCPTQELDYDWERVIAYMAASRLDRPICQCAAPSTAYWGADLAYAGGAGETGIYRTTERDLGNPFGTKRGEIYAWRRVRAPGATIRGVQANLSR